jgi:predicted anti-sigma-YlaC factor YlaD
VNCTAVRDQLTERALGAVPAVEGQVLDRHLAWCAACRKEAGELDRASATLVFALAPAEPPAELEDQVVESVQAVAAKGQPHGARRGRLAVALAVAGMVAVSGLGWGAMMAGRASRFEETAKKQKARTADVVRDFAKFLNSQEFTDPGNRVFLGTLTSDTRGATAGGSALTLASPSTADIAIVMVNGFRASDAEARLPFRVFLTSERGGRRLFVGRITLLDSGGGSIVSKQFELDLSRYTGIEVLDKGGAVVLLGSVSPRPSITTPSP